MNNTPPPTTTIKMQSLAEAKAAKRKERGRRANQGLKLPAVIALGYLDQIEPSVELQGVMQQHTTNHTGLEPQAIIALSDGDQAEASVDLQGVMQQHTQKRNNDAEDESNRKRRAHCDAKLRSTEVSAIMLGTLSDMEEIVGKPSSTKDKLMSSIKEALPTLQEGVKELSARAETHEHEAEMARYRIMELENQTMILQQTIERLNQEYLENMQEMLDYAMQKFDNFTSNVREIIYRQMPARSPLSELQNNTINQLQ